MARGRMISKSLSTSERFASLEVHAGPLCEFCQALYPLLVSHADDFGRQAGDVFTVKHLVHPTSKRSIEDFRAGLRALHESGLLIWYQVLGRQYLQVTNFEGHQSGLNKRTASKLPSSENFVQVTDSNSPQEIPGNSRENQTFPLEQNLTELNRTELKRTELQQARSVEQASNGNNGLSHHSSADADFETFRMAYPVSRRVGGKTARSAYKSAAKKVTLPIMLAALSQQQRSEQWQTPKLIPLMTTWLNQERWNQTLPEPKGYGTSAKTAGNVDALRRFAARPR